MLQGGKVYSQIEHFSYLFSSMLRLRGQIIVCIMGLCDATEQHCNHTYKDNEFKVHIKRVAEFSTEALLLQKWIIYSVLTFSVVTYFVERNHFR